MAITAYNPRERSITFDNGKTVTIEMGGEVDAIGFLFAMVEAGKMSADYAYKQYCRLAAPVYQMSDIYTVEEKR